MTPIHDTYADLLDSDATETRYRVIAALDRIYARASLSPAADERVMAAMRRPLAVPPASERGPRFRFLLGALVPASLLALGIGFVAFWRASPPRPVSAQSILQRAAAVHAPTNSVLHLVYRESVRQNSSPSGPMDIIGRDTIWAESDAHGTITQFATTDVESTQGISTSVFRCVGGRRIERCYNFQPASKFLRGPFTITAAEAAREAVPPRGINPLTGAGVPQLLTKLMHRPRASIRLLAERPFHGVLVYPIQVRVPGKPARRQPTIIYYFDAHTYILRGMTVLPPRGPGFADEVVQETMLTKRETVPRGAVPSGTFALRPPTGKQVLVVIP